MVWTIKCCTKRETQKGLQEGIIVFSLCTWPLTELCLPLFYHHKVRYTAAVNVGILTQMETSLHDEVCVDSGTAQHSTAQDRSLTCAHLGIRQMFVSTSLGTNEISCFDVSATSVTKILFVLEHEWKHAISRTLGLCTGWRVVLLHLWGRYFLMCAGNGCLPGGCMCSPVREIPWDFMMRWTYLLLVCLLV